MANTDAPRGFKPVGHYINGDVVPPPKPYLVNSSTASALFEGDLVTQETTGNIEAAVADDGVAVAGVFAYATYLDADLRLRRVRTLPAVKTGFTDIKGYVYDDYLTIFEVQADSGTVLAEATSRGKTANHVAGSGSTTTEMSGHELDSSDVGTGSQLMILDIVNRLDNEWGEHAKLLVMIYEHRLKATTAGGI